MAQIIFSKTPSLTDTPFSYCPGCTHGIGNRLVAEALDELGLVKDTVGVISVGCSVFIDKYIDVDMVQAAHGRAPAVATGVKRVLPDKIVFTYQGDGDLAAIGTAEIIHAAARGEQITVFFVNNAIYGMTGGQMAPTTLVGQKTLTTPKGRNPELAGYPIRMSEIIATMDGAAYVARVALNSPKHVLAAKRAVRKAFEVQLAWQGFAMVEFLSACPTNWMVSPKEAMELIETKMIPTFPLGEFKTPAGEAAV